MERSSTGFNQFKIMTKKNIAIKIDFSKENDRRDKEIAKIYKMCARIIKRRFKKKLIK